MPRTYQNQLTTRYNRHTDYIKPISYEQHCNNTIQQQFNQQFDYDIQNTSSSIISSTVPHSTIYNNSYRNMDVRYNTAYNGHTTHIIDIPIISSASLVNRNESKEQHTLFIINNKLPLQEQIELFYNDITVDQIINRLHHHITDIDTATHYDEVDYINLKHFVNSVHPMPCIISDNMELCQLLIVTNNQYPPNNNEYNILLYNSMQDHELYNTDVEYDIANGIIEQTISDPIAQYHTIQYQLDYELLDTTLHQLYGIDPLSDQLMLCKQYKLPEVYKYFIHVEDRHNINRQIKLLQPFNIPNTYNSYDAQQLK